MRKQTAGTRLATMEQKLHEIETSVKTLRRSPGESNRDPHNRQLEDRLAAIEEALGLTRDTVRIIQLS